MVRAPTRPPRAIGKYLIFDELASGGMATIYLGRLADGPLPRRCLAIKRMHPQFSRDPEFVAMFLDEARLAARVRHPNVVPTIDVERVAGEIVHVMPYVHGESLSHLMRATTERGERIPIRVASAIMIGALEGLHAAHEATADDGRPLEIVHRDVSPHNILVGTDGVARVLDFGVAKAAGRLHSTRGSEVKGKFAYMSPEQVQRASLDRRTDVWAATVVLWELLTGERLFAADNPAGSVQMIVESIPRPPSEIVPDVPTDVDGIVAQGLAKDPNARFASARALASALASAIPPASAAEVGAWVERVAAEELFVRATRVRVVEEAGAPAARASAEPSPPSAEQTGPGRGRAAMRSAPVIAATNEDPIPVASRRRPLIPIAIAALIALLGVGAYALTRTSPVTVPTAASGPSPSIPIAVSTSTSTPTSTSTSTPTSTSTSTPTSTSTSTSHLTARPQPSSSRPTAAPNCNPPFRFDRDGTKIPKPECL